mmetsp:Transcript_31612/g.51009  ORF Transcript_31612/g.51009 Transcript_31612/m.51009 type:complete len:82 (+) Transcript_31612:936-1181(+)
MDTRNNPSIDVFSLAGTACNRATLAHIDNKPISPLQQGDVGQLGMGGIRVSRIQGSAAQGRAGRTKHGMAKRQRFVLIHVS